MRITYSELQSLYRKRTGRDGNRNVKRGNALENLIDRSAEVSAVVELSHLPASGAKFVGPGLSHALPIDCDYHGAICGSGRGVYFDAKSCEKATRFNFKQHVSDHQRAFLVRMGMAGCVSGLLVEARDPSLQMVFWVPWFLLAGEATSVEWSDERLVEVGSNTDLIDFGFMAELVRIVAGP